MQHSTMREKVRSIAQIAVNQVSVNITNLKQLSVSIPPLAEQERIANIIAAFDSFSEGLHQQLESIKTLRSGLLSDLLSGEHEIPTSYDKAIDAA